MIVTFLISDDLYVSVFDKDNIQILRAGPFDTFESASWWGNVVIQRALNGTLNLGSDQNGELSENS